MWFKFPDGTTGISIQQQHFAVEAEDEAGGGYFRAPDHFAHLILDLPGFQRAVPPDGAPEDLPRQDPRTSNSIDRLVEQNEAYKNEIEVLKDQNSTLADEKADLEDRVAELEKQLAAKDDSGGAKKPQTPPASTSPATGANKTAEKK